jgi:hypothetical protein
MNKQQIINLLETNDKAVIRAIVVLNERQTADERRSQETKYHNNEGVRPCHARMLTSMANWYRVKGYLSPKQIAWWRKRGKTGTMRIAIYAGQLLEIALAKKAVEAMEG